jgi:trehalose-phosphatase
MRVFTIDTAEYDAVIFDLDGVVTQTAKVHAAAWKALFDEFLEKRKGKGYRPFDPDADYRRYVDGKPRYDGVQSFLASRDIDLPYGSPDDSSDMETICGLGNRKNEYFQKYLKRDGVEVYHAATDLIRQLRDAGIRTAVVSSSKNCVPVLKAAGIADLFDVKIDGVDSEERGLPGKPAPDIFLEAAAELGVDPGRSVVVEDAVVGVQAGRKGGFGCVIWVNRKGHNQALPENQADMVVADLSQLGIAQTHDLPSALEAQGEISSRLSKGRTAVFLDYDGTLTPIVSRPEDAVLSNAMRSVLKDLAERCTVAILSGRDLPDVKEKVGIDHLVYAGSHGFDIAGPQDLHITSQQGTSFLPTLDKAQEDLNKELSNIPGAMVERKKFSIAVHYRNVKAESASDVSTIVNRVHADYPELRKSEGKKVLELQPGIDWNKGKALLWLLGKLGLDQPDVIPMYIGDDVTDEDAFKVLADRGIGIVVQEAPRPSAAQYRLNDTDEVYRFLHWVVGIG